MTTNLKNENEHSKTLLDSFYFLIVSYLIRFFGTNITLKTVGTLLNPQKGSVVTKKSPDMFTVSKTQQKNSPKPSKDRPVYWWKDPSSTKPFLSSAHHK